MIPQVRFGTNRAAGDPHRAGRLSLRRRQPRPRLGPVHAGGPRHRHRAPSTPRSTPGINYIDTAPGYGDGNSESIIGEATQGRRDQFILATKVGYRGLRREDVTASVEASLRRLRTDVIDVIQFHGGMYTPSERPSTSCTRACSTRCRRCASRARCASSASPSRSPGPPGR